MDLNTIEKLPSIRDLFFTFGVFGETTPEFEEKKSWYPYFMNIATEGEVLYG